MFFSQFALIAVKLSVHGFISRYFTVNIATTIALVRDSLHIDVAFLEPLLECSVVVSSSDTKSSIGRCKNIVTIPGNWEQNNAPLRRQTTEVKIMPRIN